MNSDMAKRHWKWATNALNAANRDALNHDPQNAVPRAYYAMMHAANAALALKDPAAEDAQRYTDAVQRALGATGTPRQTFGSPVASDARTAIVATIRGARNRKSGCQLGCQLPKTGRIAVFRKPAMLFIFNGLRVVPRARIELATP